MFHKIKMSSLLQISYFKKSKAFYILISWEMLTTYHKLQDLVWEVQNWTCPMLRSNRLQKAFDLICHEEQTWTWTLKVKNFKRRLFKTTSSLSRSSLEWEGCGVMKGEVTHSGIDLGISKCETNENFKKNIRMVFDWHTLWIDIIIDFKQCMLKPIFRDEI